MDDFKPNKSVDGMMGGGGGYPPQKPDEPDNTNQQNPHDEALADLGPVNQPQQPVYSGHHDSQDLHISGNGGSSSKAAKVFAVIFGLLFLAALALAYFQYTQAQDYKKQVDDLNNQVQQLKSEIYSVKYDNKDTVKKQEVLTQKAEALQAKAKQLKDLCGQRCAIISIE